MTQSIRKAIFPVAGLGTRFLPATKAMPKEMLTVVDRPVIQHVVDEARQGGAEHLIFVTGRNKGVIEDHFDRPFELEHTLRQRNKLAELEALNRFLPAPGQTSFTRQQEPLGLGHAVWCARDIVGHEPFALLLPDVLVKNDGPSCLAQMMDVYNELSAAGEKVNLIAVEEVPQNEVSSYGIVGIEPGDGPLWPITAMVEKPSVAEAPSNLIIMGRYLLQPEIFDILSSQERGAGNEIQITDAMKTLMKTQRFYAYKYSGRSFDCGSKLGFLLANAAFALDHKELGPRFAEEMGKLLAG
ncbi:MULTISPECIES: UTP--glucose-1-phosphate uridylyltransferase GalU [Rhodomicrobium]|uniref:UTP--glucose-1-phosphate uridylyltransferase GalU n=1 Tax=Rhodomicrobium TaxID=1068 RepID=UPI000B4A7FC7|nr:MULTISPECIES: UTP--glucose-1-phosphate uridylyltransferase GalU [Rhodomicrobium]